MAQEETHRDRQASNEQHALQLARAAMDQDEARRDAWLDAHCAGNTALRQRVDALLQRVGQVTMLPADRADIEPLSPAAVAGSHLGPFRLIEPVGRGGMGEVWRGERCEGGFEQTVAIKLMLNGLSGWSQRFRRERQILARLNHPHIAHLIDGGLTESGQPWLAMEYVDGESIIAWCDRKRLGIEDRVRLMLPVCAAVQFAHQALVIHRDLKPANILVDSSGRPRLLDFGIAKLLDETDPGQTQTLIMTPAYAAPEQRSGDPVTTATDVYQLGAVLFELLSGQSVRNCRVSRSGQVISVRRDDAAADDAATRRRIAEERRTSPQRMQTLLRGDIGRIIGKALAEDPLERYGSARELADDLDNWLHERPVRARRIDAAYRLRKFLRRNSLAVAVSGLLAIGLVAAATVAWQRAQAEKQQQVRTEKALRFMRDLFSASRPESTGGDELTVAQLLEGAAGRIDSQFADDPQSRGGLLAELGDVYRGLCSYDQAIDLLESARSLQVPVRMTLPLDYLYSTVSAAQARNEMYRYDEAIALADEGLAFIDSASLDDADSWRESLRSIKADALSRSGHLDEAEFLYRQLLEGRADEAAPTGTLAIRYNDFGHLLLQTGRAHEAIEQFAHAERLLERVPDATRMHHLVVATSRALAHHSAGENRIAVARFEAAMPGMEQYLGEGHNRTTITRSQMAQSLSGLGQYRRALVLIEKNLEVMAAPGAASDMDRVLVGNVVRPRLLLASLRLDEALPLAREGAAYLDAHMAGPTYERVVVRTVLGDTLLRLGQFDQADSELRQAYGELRAVRGMASDRVDAGFEDALGRLALLRGDADEAVERLAAAVDASIQSLGEDHPRTTRLRVHLVWARMREGFGPAHLDELASLRQSLAAQLANDEAPQLWQIDQLVGEQAEASGMALPEAACIARSIQALRQESGLDELPRFTGLSAL